MCVCRKTESSHVGGRCGGQFSYSEQKKLHRRRNMQEKDSGEEEEWKDQIWRLEEQNSAVCIKAVSICFICFLFPSTLTSERKA